MQRRLIELFQNQAKSLNLLSEKDCELIESKHFPDCLEFLNIWHARPKNPCKVLDLGTGGGMPGLILAEALPHYNFTLVDSRGKKIKAVMNISDNLSLQNVRGIVNRFEILAHEPEHRGIYDIVTARAVAPLPVLLEYAVAFLKVGGLLFAWKGPNFHKEISKAQRAMTKLNIKLENQHYYRLPSGESRVILVFKKIFDTAKNFPRSNGKPKKSPL